MSLAAAPHASPPPGDMPVAGGGLTFEALFFRRLQSVTAQIHETENLDQLMLDVSQDICRLFDADRLTLYAVTEDGAGLVSKVKTSLNTSQALKLPVGTSSIAGFVAYSKQWLNIADVYDDEELRKIHPSPKFLKEVDKRSGYRTRQMLVLPIMIGNSLLGVLQLINCLSRPMFGELEVEGAIQLCKTLATAIRQRNGEGRLLRKRSKYDTLVQDGDVTAAEMETATVKARESGTPIEQLLATEYKVPLARIGASVSQFFAVPYEPFSPGRIRSDALLGSLKYDYVKEHHWVPLEDSPEGLVVMCLDPEALQLSRIVTQVFSRTHRVSYRVTTRKEFDDTVAQLFGGGGSGLPGGDGDIDQMLADMSASADDDPLEEDASASAAADNELVKFVNQIIVEAYRQGASDIHIEPLPGKFKTGVRFRIDGSLQPYLEVPAHFRNAMVTRLKIMCDLDISEKRKPQDGKIKFKKYGPLDIELRVATIPSTGGEDVVMRILAAGEPIPLDKLGLTAHTRKRLETAISRPHGLFYVCGPTGSGKTTTLHSVLHRLNTPDTKIWTAEDPVEITQKGLRQVQVNKKAGIDFALVMRAFLRADPDVIMVGESRDKETVSMGVEASLTGHLVFSTLHTNSAPESITRLLDMGMDPFNFADALLGILAQRLVKRLCVCKEAYQPDETVVDALVAEYAEPMHGVPAWKQDPEGETSKVKARLLEEYGQEGRLTLYRTVGCDKCKQTGYKGRLGVHELLISDEETRALIQGRARVAEVTAQAILGGMRTLKMDAMEKVLMGMTDLAQARAVG
ncbi:MAG: GspE/PulE family protein [Pseudomonadota bacterium]